MSNSNFRISDMEFLHPYFCAGNSNDLDRDFEEGKRRAIRTLQARIDRLQTYTLADYDATFGVADKL